MFQSRYASQNTTGLRGVCVIRIYLEYDAGVAV